MASHRVYGPRFHTVVEDGSRRSAEIVVPLVVDQLRPASVVDVGCGSGSWLAEFKRHGVAEVLGIDGQREAVELRIEEAEFMEHDLVEPLRLDRRFDLVTCLEVAEHLPAANAARFVRQLADLAPAVLFSAAIPHQGGTGHVNEQWPDYWAELFLANGMVVVDSVRPEIWANPDVEYWYAQNLLLFVRPEVLVAHERLAAAAAVTRLDALARVHPRLYEAKALSAPLSLRRVTEAMRAFVPGAVASRLRRMSNRLNRPH